MYVVAVGNKPPKSLLNDVKFDGLRKFEMDKTLSKYIAYCAKVVTSPMLLQNM